MLRKIQKFLKLNFKTKQMLIEAYLLLAWARYRKWKDFSKIAPDLGRRMEETSLLLTSEELVVAKLVAKTIHMASYYTFWESECLVKAIAGMRMLEKRGIASTLYLGVAKGEKGLKAHAWLRSGTFYVSGSGEMENYTVVEKFAKFI